MKTVSEEIIRKRVQRTGDGTHKWSTNREQLMNILNNPDFEHGESNIFGWTDNDMDIEEKNDAIICNKEKEA